MRAQDYKDSDNSKLVDKTAGTGTVKSWNVLAEDATINGGEPAKHQPYLQFHADRTVTISVRGGGGALKGSEPGRHAPEGELHPMAWDVENPHVIERVFIVDQDGNVHCDHAFSPFDKEAQYHCTTPLPSSVLKATPVEYCNLHVSRNLVMSSGGNCGAIIRVGCCSWWSGSTDAVFRGFRLRDGRE